MRMRRLFLVIACLATFWPAVSARAADCHRSSDLSFFGQVVELVDGRRDLALGCWVVRLRLRPSHAMACRIDVCGTPSPFREGIHWWQASVNNENIKSVTPVEHGSCTDVSFCIQPYDAGETMLITFVALYGENWSIPPSTYRPRWNDGVIDLSSLDHNKSHCQDSDPRGAICLW